MPTGQLACHPEKDIDLHSHTSGEGGIEYADDEIGKLIAMAPNAPRRLP
ncbi:hypothetical protein [Herbaspirillum sp. ST 5-3]|nr:hypothetical protein [Herbaspirillum sp. ST 5-3]